MSSLVKLYFSTAYDFLACNPHCSSGFQSVSSTSGENDVFPIGSPGWDAALDETPSEWAVPSLRVVRFESLISCKTQAVTISNREQT